VCKCVCVACALRVVLLAVEGTCVCMCTCVCVCVCVSECGGACVRLRVRQLAVYFVAFSNVCTASAFLAENAEAVYKSIFFEKNLLLTWCLLT